MDPPLEFAHNWRQSLTNMIARNFYENGANLLYPTIDMAGEKTGIIGSEFPLFNYLIYVFSELFGYAHWYGRLINLVVSTLGVYFFYKLIKEFFTEKTAFYSAIVLAVSLWFGFSRKSMPDTFSVSLVIIGLYYAYSYLKTGKSIPLILYFVFVSLGMLSKIPALSLFAAVGIVPFLSGIYLRRKILFTIASLLAFLIVVWWYFVWVPHLLKEYQFQLYFPKGFLEGLKEIQNHLPQLAEQFYFNSLSSFIGFFASIVGLFFLIKESGKWIITSFGIIILFFVAFIIKTGAVFPTHSYYIIPFTPLMALFVGYLLFKLPSKISVVVAALIVVESIGNQQHDFFIKDTERYMLSLESILDENIGKDDLIVINGGPSPQHIYFANRKGWTITDDKLTTGYLDSVQNHGADFLVLDVTKTELGFTEFEEVYNDEYYKLYKLR